MFFPALKSVERQCTNIFSRKKKGCCCYYFGWKWGLKKFNPLIQSKWRKIIISMQENNNNNCTIRRNNSNNNNDDLFFFALSAFFIWSLEIIRSRRWVHQITRFLFTFITFYRGIYSDLLNPSSRCQFHQRFTYKFFWTNVIFLVTFLALSKNSYEKHARITFMKLTIKADTMIQLN